MVRKSDAMRQNSLQYNSEDDKMRNSKLELVLAYVGYLILQSTQNNALCSVLLQRFSD